MIYAIILMSQSYLLALPPNLIGYERTDNRILYPKSNLSIEAEGSYYITDMDQYTQSFKIKIWKPARVITISEQGKAKTFHFLCWRGGIVVAQKAFYECSTGWISFKETN